MLVRTPTGGTRTWVGCESGHRPAYTVASPLIQVLTLGLILQGGRSSGVSAGARGNGWDLGYRVTARAQERGPQGRNLEPGFCQVL